MRPRAQWRYRGGGGKKRVMRNLRACGLRAGGDGARLATPAQRVAAAAQGAG